MTFAAVGSVVPIGAGTTFALSPVTVGDLFIATIVAESATIFVTGISSTNITWAQAGTSFQGTQAGGGNYCSVWLGKATATGSAVQTVALSGTAPTIRGVAQEFSSSVGSWALDGPQGNLDNAGTATCPSLTPSRSGDIYLYQGRETGTGTAGSTTGYTYISDGAGNEGCYNAACTSAAQAPVFGNSDGRSGIAILVMETPGRSLVVTRQAVNRAANY